MLLKNRMNVENIYHSLNELLKDETNYDQLRNRIEALTSNIRVSLNKQSAKTITSSNVTKANCPTCGQTLPTTNNTQLVNTQVNTNNKKALLIGINYIGTDAALNGCINDVNDMCENLISRYNFVRENIEIITDNTEIKPTKANILTAFTNLLKNSKSGDTLVFAYSGHGINMRDKNRDEWDGFDEFICPLDMNFISDDELSNIVKNNLKSGVNIFTLFDCCNSGSILDLRYQYLDTMRGRRTVTNTNYSELMGNLVCISGCQDNQTSADSFINGRYNGALTWAFLQSIKSLNRPNWLDLLNNMRTLLQQNKYSQIAQMSSGKLLVNTSLLFL